MSSKVRRRWNKVFEIGFAKTGTSSLGFAFRILGLKHMGWREDLWFQCRDGDYIETLKTAEKYEAFEDGPWHDFSLYRELDKKFPDSKFILLERDDDAWLRSMESHFFLDVHDIGPELRIYGDVFDENKKTELLTLKKERYQQIKEYFKQRSDALLIMNICSGEGWEKLCPFLESELPIQEFPHINRSIRNPALKMMSSIKSKIFNIFKA